MLIVLINGPKQSGKSTLSQQVYGLLKPQLKARVTEQHLKEPIEAMLRSLALDAYPEHAKLTYEDLKKAMFGATTGRQIMIAIGNSLRGLDSAWLPRVVLRKIMDTNVPTPVAIVDDCGFEDEWQAFRALGGTELMTLYTEERAERLYAHGEQFENDNRFCLRGHADFIDPDPVVVAQAIMARLGE